MQHDKGRIPTALPCLQFGCCRKGKGDNMEEVWKDIAGYEGLYQVSNLGRVKSTPRSRTKGGIMTQHYDKRGYKVVMLCKDAKAKMCKVHRLVAGAFIPNPDNKPQINHKDECKTNNCVFNLEWCDNLYNARYGTKGKRAYATRKRTGSGFVNEEKAVVQYDLNGRYIKEYPSETEAAKSLGNKDQSNISKCCRHLRKTAYGYIWEYK